MKFLLLQEIRQGKYYVKVALKEFTDVDQNKAKTFGMPVLNIRHEAGPITLVPINQLASYPQYGFNNQVDANNYATKLKNDIHILKNNWENLKDNWSKQEEL